MVMRPFILKTMLSYARPPTIIRGTEAGRRRREEWVRRVAVSLGARA
jgi:hypothetical protein